LPGFILALECRFCGSPITCRSSATDIPSLTVADFLTTALWDAHACKMSINATMIIYLMRSPPESNYSFSILSLKRSTRSLLLPPKRAIRCHFLQKRPFWTILYRITISQFLQYGNSESTKKTIVPLSSWVFRFRHSRFCYLFPQAHATSHTISTITMIVPTIPNPTYYHLLKANLTGLIHRQSAGII